MSKQTNKQTSQPRTRRSPDPEEFHTRMKQVSTSSETPFPILVPRPSRGERTSPESVRGAGHLPRIGRIHDGRVLYESSTIPVDLFYVSL